MFFMSFDKSLDFDPLITYVHRSKLLQLPWKQFVSEIEFLGKSLLAIVATVRLLCYWIKRIL